jgi:hypothetical protein
MEQILAAAIGAVVGAVITGLIAWKLQRSNESGNRNWEIALKISEVLGAILSAYTPDTLKTKEDIWKLQQEWGLKARELHILGFGGGSNDPLSRVLNEYFEDLLSFVEGNMQRGALEHKRENAKKEAKELMKRFTK